MENTILDKHGMPKYEDCAYIKISKGNLGKVVDLLTKNDIPNVYFLRSGEAFCYDEAEFRLRAYYRETESDELIVEQMALDEKECFGQFFDYEFTEGNILDNDYIDALVTNHFSEGEDDE